MRHLLAIVFCLILSSCGKPAGQYTDGDGPTSSLTLDQALSLARSVAFMHPGWTFSQTVPEGENRSNLPAFGRNTVFVIEQANVADIQEQDFIMFDRSGNVIHYVYAIDGDNVITKGLNNTSIDRDYVKDSNLKGRVVMAIYHRGY